MKLRYKVLGTQMVGDFVRLLLKPDNAIEEKEVFNPMEMAEKGLDFSNLMQQAEKMAIRTATQDHITIPYDEWKKHEFKINDIILIEVSTE